MLFAYDEVMRSTRMEEVKRELEKRRREMEERGLNIS